MHFEHCLGRISGALKQKSTPHNFTYLRRG
jgi:hypothetical protein